MPNVILRDRWEDSRKVVADGRLIWYSGAKTAAAWNDHWRETDAKGLLDAARQGHYSYRRLLHQCLDKKKPVLEGGCGVGYIVIGLQTDGYDVLGVEQSAQVVDFVKELAPDCNIMVGDILNLADTPDSHYGSYISLGVVEHLPHGPEEALKEVNRVTCQGGTLLISVPHFNPWRRFKHRWHLYPMPPETLDPEDFYQYAFTKREFTALLQRSGFRVEFTDHTSAPGGIGREFGAIGRKLRRWPLISQLLAATEHIGLLRRLFGHSAIYLAKKVGPVEV